MGRLVFACGAGSLALFAACNSLSGVDDLTSAPTNHAALGDAAPPSTTLESGHEQHPPPPTTSSSGAPNDPGPGDAGAGFDAASEAAALLPTFTDDFARPDGTTIGNGWLEKTPGAFPLVSGAPQQNKTGIYRNLFVARPPGENILDVLVQETVTFSVSTADPCLFARIQNASATTDRFYGYSVYPDGPANLYVSRDDGTAFTDLGSLAISPPLVVGQSYRLALEVTGTSPVHLVGSISKLDGTVLASITANDGSAKKIVTAGSVGFGSSVAQGARFDDFRRVTLP